MSGADGGVAGPRPHTVGRAQRADAWIPLGRRRRSTGRGLVEVRRPHAQYSRSLSRARPSARFRSPRAAIIDALFHRYNRFTDNFLGGWPWVRWTDESQSSRGPDAALGASTH